MATMTPGQLTGNGFLWLDGARVSGPLRYTVRVEQRGIMMAARGHLIIEPHVAFAVIERQGPNSDLVLALEDGRRWPCTLQSTDGDLLGRGAIE
jgi:hypothetical protein